MTDFHDISLGITSTLLLAALWWSTALRRRVKEQTERIRCQLEKEADLERKYTDLFENANDMVFSLDEEGCFTGLNKTSERILGRSREQCQHRKLEHFVLDSHLSGFQEWLARCRSGATLQPLEFEVRAGTGTQSILELTARPICAGEKVIGIQGIARDITERRRAEEALRQSEERFSSAFRASPVAIAVSSLVDGTYIDVNESFLRLFGFQREEVIGYTPSGLNLWADAKQQKKLAEVLLKRESVVGVEGSFRVKSGEIRKALLFIEPINLGKTPCILSILHDMTERLSLEEKLRKAMKLEAVGRLAASVAHDFNNLLTVIQGNADLALYQNSKNPSVAKALDRISEASRRAGNLTRQLLTLSRRQTPQPKPLDLNQLINGATRLFKHLLPDELHMRFKFASHLPIINADPTMLEQVIMNLVINARDAMSKGGELTIETRRVEINAAYLKIHPEASEGDHVCLVVTDTGCGMDLETQAKIFEPFFTTKAVGKGTGLGLATVYGIVNQHKGWIEVASELGKGSTFTVYFRGQAPRSDVKANSSIPSAELRKTILVVEDEPGVAELTSAVLQENGYRVLEASDGLSALQVWNDHRDSIDLLLTDINMPHGMSGIDLAENLRALNPKLKLVYMSGGNVDSLLSNSEIGKEGIFIAKPFSPASLQKAVRATLN